MDFLISKASAQEAAGGIGGMLTGSPIGQFLPLILIFVVFYFLLIRPQQQQQKALKEKIAAVKRGDRVLTAGGIVGVITKVKDGNEVEVEIAPNVRVAVAKDTLSTILNTTTVAANDK